MRLCFDQIQMAFVANKVSVYESECQTGRNEDRLWMSMANALRFFAQFRKENQHTAHTHTQDTKADVTELNLMLQREYKRQISPT